MEAGSGAGKAGVIGRSGAVVEVLDRVAYKYGGPDDLYAQAELCERLGPAVAPVILEKYKRANSYYMEKLQPLSNRNPLVLTSRAAKLLSLHVWPQSSTYDESYPDWRESVDEYASGSGLPSVRDLYQPQKTVYRLIHGDPTFANMMERKDGDLVLIDPVPARANVPSVVEMDMARIVQSLYGWEHALDPDGWAMVQNPEMIMDRIFQRTDHLRARRTYFWAAYNCLRIIRKNVDATSVGWASTNLKLFLEKL